MGAWGHGITSDDTVCDILDSITTRLKCGESLESATRAAESEHAELKDDPDEGPLLWLAIAHAQWKYGTVAPRVLEQVRDDIESGRGLERWEEDPRDLEKREAALAKFLAKIESPNPKPSRLPKLVIRKAPFREGDCLSVSLPNGLYTAVLVLRVDNSDPELGMNLVGCLDYLSQTPPDLRVFTKKRWLVHEQETMPRYRVRTDKRTGKPKVRGRGKTKVKKREVIFWVLPRGWRTERKRFEVVGNIGWIRRIPRRRAFGDYGFSAWEGVGSDILGQDS